MGTLLAAASVSTAFAQQTQAARCDAAIDENAANTRKIAAEEKIIKSAPASRLSVICPRARTWLKLIENRMNTLNAIEIECKRVPNPPPGAVEALERVLKTSYEEAIEGASEARTWVKERC